MHLDAIVYLSFSHGCPETSAFHWPVMVSGLSLAGIAYYNLVSLLTRLHILREKGSCILLSFVFLETQTVLEA